MFQWHYFIAVFLLGTAIGVIDDKRLFIVGGITAVLFAAAFGIGWGAIAVLELVLGYYSGRWLAGLPREIAYWWDRNQKSVFAALLGVGVLGALFLVLKFWPSEDTSIAVAFDEQSVSRPAQTMPAPQPSDQKAMPDLKNSLANDIIGERPSCVAVGFSGRRLVRLDNIPSTDVLVETIPEDGADRNYRIYAMSCALGMASMVGEATDSIAHEATKRDFVSDQYFLRNLEEVAADHPDARMVYDCVCSL
jgi:hypothetical protein